MLDQLPDDLIALVCMYMSFNDIRSMLCVVPSVRTVVQSPSFWHQRLGRKLDPSMVKIAAKSILNGDMHANGSETARVDGSETARVDVSETTRVDVSETTRVDGSETAHDGIGDPIKRRAVDMDVIWLNGEYLSRKHDSHFDDEVVRLNYVCFLDLRTTFKNVLPGTYIPVFSLQTRNPDVCNDTIFRAVDEIDGSILTTKSLAMTNWNEAAGLFHSNWFYIVLDKFDLEETKNIRIEIFNLDGIIWKRGLRWYDVRLFRFGPNETFPDNSEIFERYVSKEGTDINAEQHWDRSDVVEYYDDDLLSPDIDDNSD